MERVLLTTGGTGGHIFPALAVAEALRLRHPGVELLFVGSQYGPEQRLARAAGIDFIGLPVRGFLGRGLRAFAAAGRMAWASSGVSGPRWWPVLAAMPPSRPCWRPVWPVCPRCCMNRTPSPA